MGYRAQRQSPAGVLVLIALFTCKPVEAADVVGGIAAIPEYQEAFRQAFGSAPDARNLARAIAAYERSQVAYDSPFDHFIAGERGAIDAAAQRGWELFNTRARCNKCHALSENKRDTTNFTDNDFHNVGEMIVRHDVA